MKCELFDIVWVCAFTAEGERSEDMMNILAFQFVSFQTSKTVIAFYIKFYFIRVRSVCVCARDTVPRSLNQEAVAWLYVYANASEWVWSLASMWSRQHREQSTMNASRYAHARQPSVDVRFSFYLACETHKLYFSLFYVNFRTKRPNRFRFVFFDNVVVVFFFSSLISHDRPFWECLAYSSTVVRSVSPFCRHRYVRWLVFSGRLLVALLRGGLCLCKLLWIYIFWWFDFRLIKRMSERHRRTIYNKPLNCCGGHKFYGDLSMVSIHFCFQTIPDPSDAPRSMEMLRDSFSIDSTHFRMK